MLTDKRIVVTGGDGFLGKHVVKRLQDIGYDVFIVRSKEYDLRYYDDVYAMYANLRPDIVIHLAAVVGGIGANKENPAKFYYDNLIMGSLLLELGHEFNVSKFLTIGTTCSYPKFTPAPFKELDFWNGYPEDTNAPYGIAKKALLVQSQAYREQYGFNAIYLILANLYGPGDNFGDDGHVIPHIIKKCVDSDDCIYCWGTGNATREFLYVDDAAEAIVLAMENYNGGEPVNVGNGQEISIKELVTKIAEISGFKGSVLWDSSKPDGQPRRCLDVSKAKQFGFAAKVGLEEGLKRTVDWYASSDNRR